MPAAVSDTLLAASPALPLHPERHPGALVFPACVPAPDGVGAWGLRAHLDPVLADWRVTVIRDIGQIRTYWRTLPVRLADEHEADTYCRKTIAIALGVDTPEANVA